MATRDNEKKATGLVKGEFNLLNNAKDSIRQAVELLALKEIGSDHACLKHAITASAHCIELLLKERLHRIHPAFVWEKVEMYPSLKAHTVTVETAIMRLKSIGKVPFSKKDEEIMKSLRNTRNAIEHYEWTVKEKEAKVIIGNALSFAFAFAQDELQEDLASDFKKDDTWKMFFDDLHEFVSSHGARLEARMRAKCECPQCCDECGECTIPLSGGSCDLCGHWQSIDDDA